MPVTRRHFLRTGGRALSAAAVGAAPFAARPAARWQTTIAADMPAPDAAALILGRAAFGPRPGAVEQVRARGVADWLEEQLDPAGIDDATVDDALAPLATLRMGPKALLDLYADDNGARSVNELLVGTMYRQVFSRRQLYEVMVDFWSDHFSVYVLQDRLRALKTVDDREVIRKHALGNFGDMLRASAHSPCMLHYLDNDVSSARRLNENYAREIMELHTLGAAVDGVPYSEQDVVELARCLTGWTWDTRKNSPTLGSFAFAANNHDNQAKRLFGQRIPALQGQQDGEDALEMLLARQATPVFVATKLVRRFVTDDPETETPELVARVAEAFRRSAGDIPTMLRALFASPEFAASFGGYGGKVVRPLDLVVRTLRASGAGEARLEPAKGFLECLRVLLGRTGYLTAMGHIPFYWLTPDGYPDRKERWISSSSMLARWNLGLALVDGRLIAGFRPQQLRPAHIETAEALVDHWVEALLHRPIRPADRALLLDHLTDGGRLAFADAARLREGQLVALILDSPYFHWR